MASNSNIINSVIDFLNDADNLLLDMEMTHREPIINLLDETINNNNSPQQRVEAATNARRNRSRPMSTRRNQRRPMEAAVVEEVIDLCSPNSPGAYLERVIARGRRRTAPERTSLPASSARQRRRLYSTRTPADVVIEDSFAYSANISHEQPADTNGTSNENQPSSQLMCPICADSLSTPVSTLCGHIFCKSCLERWLQQTKKCPVCKAGGVKLKTHPIFI